MTVKELIKHLESLPQDAICITNGADMETSGDKLMSKPYQSNEGSVRKVSTHDAFDGTPFTYEQYSTAGGELSVVKF